MLLVYCVLGALTVVIVRCFIKNHGVSVYAAKVSLALLELGLEDSKSSPEFRTFVRERSISGFKRSDLPHEVAVNIFVSAFVGSQLTPRGASINDTAWECEDNIEDWGKRGLVRPGFVKFTFDRLLPRMREMLSPSPEEDDD